MSLNAWVLEITWCAFKLSVTAEKEAPGGSTTRAGFAEELHAERRRATPLMAVRATGREPDNNRLSWGSITNPPRHSRCLLAAPLLQPGSAEHRGSAAGIPPPRAHRRHPYGHGLSRPAREWRRAHEPYSSVRPRTRLGARFAVPA